jgi:hypothetical protein
MGVVGIASVIAVSFTLDEEQPVQAAGSSTTALLDQSGQEAAPASEAATAGSTATAIAPTQESTPTATPQVVENTVAVAPAGQVQEQIPQSSASTSCRVRCDRRCSYPGHCHRYRDTNGNNLCDEGECT